MAGLAFGLVAALVLRDGTENRLGWIFAAVAVLEAVCAASAELATYLFRSGRAGGGADLVAWLGSVLWMPGFLMLLVAVPLLFPDGRLASPRWRWPAAAALPGWTVAVLGYATTDAAVQDGYPQADNPFDLPFPDEPQLASAVVGSSRPFSSAFSPWRADPPDAPARPAGAGRHAWFVAGLLLDARDVDCRCPTRSRSPATRLPGLSAWDPPLPIVRHRDCAVADSRVRATDRGALAAYLLAAFALGVRTGAEIGPAVVAAVSPLLWPELGNACSGSSTTCCTANGATRFAR